MYILIVSVLFFGFTTVVEKSIDPTGTYRLGKKRKGKKEIHVYFGDIKVKALAKNKIAVVFNINAGAPSYNSGFFTDTLEYKVNQAIYTIPEYDRSCKIIFDFVKKGVMVKQETDDFNFSCGFGAGVIVDDFFKKKSSDEPEISIQ